MVQKATNARERFEQSASVLFQERGYADTTVPEISARAGLTERTFYRYFADKREVLFWRAGEHLETIVAALSASPQEVHPLTAVCHAFEAVASFIDGQSDVVRVRLATVATHRDLQEREMIKLQALAMAIDAALQKRGLNRLAARLTAELGVVIWKVALETWSADEKKRNFAHHVLTLLHESSHILPIANMR